MAYNPNELAKVKHIIALAKAISGDLDGDLTDDRPTPTFSATKTTFSKASAGNNTMTDDGGIYAGSWIVPLTITYNGDGTLIFPLSDNYTVGELVKTSSTTYGGQIAFTSNATLPQTITVGATETDNYKAATPITITLTA